jgi:mRNA-degrading endonuclease toxin of MazEF toxin-antitoxin module
MKCGSAYLLYDDEDPSSKPHLHVVISDPDENDCIVLVSVTTERAKSDTTTRLEAGIHRFITAPSVIAYNYSKIMSRDQLRNLIETGDALPKDDASDTIVRRAQAGIQETRRAPREVQECFLAWWTKQDRR